MMNVTRTNRFLITFFSMLLLIGCNGQKATPTEKVSNEATTTETTRTPAEPASTTKPASTTESTEPAASTKTDAPTKPTGVKMSANPVIKIETSKGTMMLELNGEKAPKTVANFVSYVEDGFYDGLIFHRVIPSFMVQGGGMNPDMSEKADKKPPIKNEANNGLKNDRGTVAMARTGDPHSASSQFFINLKDNDFLNFTSESQAGWGYAVFGKITEGLDVIDEIAKVKTGNHGGHGDVPLEAVTITKMSVVK